MGPGIETYTSDVTLRGSAVTVYLTSSAYRQELSMGKSKIIKLMNEELGGDLIKELHLR